MYNNVNLPFSQLLFSPIRKSSSRRNVDVNNIYELFTNLEKQRESERPKEQGKEEAGSGREHVDERKGGRKV